MPLHRKSCASIARARRCPSAGPISGLALALLFAGCSEDKGTNDDGASATTSAMPSADGTTPSGASSTTSPPSGPVNGLPATTPVPDPANGPTSTNSASATPTNAVPMNPTASASGGANGGGGSEGGGAQGGNDSTGNTGGEGAGGENMGGQGTAGENTGGAPGEGGNAGSVANGGTAGTVANGGGSQGGEGPGDGYMPCPTNGDPCAVLPLGDSITEGCCNFEGGYRTQLFRRAVLDGKNLTFTGTLSNGPTTVENQPFPRQHEGRGGFTIDGISGQVTDDAIAGDVPHIVLLMIGTNDLNGNVDVDQAPNRLDDLIDQIITEAPDALVVVATIIPMVNGNGPRVPTYNVAIADLVDSRAAQGDHVVLVDNYAAFTADANYASAWMSDTLHPNTAGYVVLGDSFYDVIGPYLPDAP